LKYSLSEEFALFNEEDDEEIDALLEVISLICKLSVDCLLTFIF